MPNLRGDRSRICSERAGRAAVLRDVAEKDAVDVGIEIDLGSRRREGVELVGVPRRADVRPALEHVRLVEPALGMTLLDHHAPRPWPVAQLVRGEDRREPQVVLLRSLLADARALAFPHLPREARAAALLPPELAPAQAMLAREPFEHRLHVRLRGERAV